MFVVPLLLWLQTAAAPSQEVKVDRNAFTFISYRLRASVTPASHALDAQM